MNLKIERVKRSWSQNDLSKLSGVSRSIISQIENGNIDNIKFGTLKRLAEVLNSTVEELFLKEE